VTLKAHVVKRKKGETSASGELYAKQRGFALESAGKLICVELLKVRF
jgi:hypothetical protein